MKIEFCRQQLSLIKSYEFSAKSSKEDGWKGTGLGTVMVDKSNLDTLLFLEEGFFKNARGKFKTHNSYRWTFNNLGDTISLEHLRFGAESPVYLFDMTYEEDNVWSSQCPHLCDKDEYHAKMFLATSFINLEWNITNAKDSSYIQYKYLF